jgi:hypothetical protein
MRYLEIVLACCLVFSGCDSLKGSKGDTGPTGPAGQSGNGGLQSVEDYTGIPTSNPYIVNLSTPITSTCVLQYYMVSASGVSYTLPLTIAGVESHYIYGTTTSVAFATAYNTPPNPAIALNSIRLGQCSYYFSIKRFQTPAACIAYKKSIGKLDTNSYDTLIYGREIPK